MASLWDMISGNEAAMQQINPTYGVPQQFVRDSAINALGQIGGLLMAAGQPVDPAVRAQMLAQIGGVGSAMGTDIYKAAQSRLMGAQYQQQMADMEAQKRFQQMFEAARKGVGGPAAPGAATPGATVPGVATPGTTVPGAVAPRVTGGLQGLTAQEIAYLDTLPTTKMKQEAYTTLMQQKLTKPSTEQEIPLTAEERAANNIPEGQPAFKKVRNLPDGTQAITGYNIPNIQRPESALNAPMFKMATDRLTEGQAAASAAANTLRSNETMLKLLNEGALTGALAPAQLQGAQYISALQDVLGIESSERLTNIISKTQAFESEVGRKVLSMVKDLGPNPSNADREYANKIAAGDIKLNAESIRKVIEISNRAEQRKIESYNKLVKGFRESEGLNAQQRKILEPFLQPVEPPKGRSQTFTTGKGMSWSVED